MADIPREPEPEWIEAMAASIDPRAFASNTRWAPGARRVRKITARNMAADAYHALRRALEDRHDR